MEWNPKLSSAMIIKDSIDVSASLYENIWLRLEWVINTQEIKLSLLDDMIEKFFLFS